MRTVEKEKCTALHGVPTMFIAELNHQGVTTTADEIKKYFKDKISRHKIPKHIILTDSFPMTASGKIQKFKLREQSINLLT